MQEAVLTGGAVPAASPALQLTGLGKRFGETTAVDDIDLTLVLRAGRPNGAGKTT